MRVYSSSYLSENLYEIVDPKEIPENCETQNVHKLPISSLEKKGVYIPTSIKFSSTLTPPHWMEYYMT